MDYIKTEFSLLDCQRTVAVWVQENFARPARREELVIANLDDPVAFARKMQADPQQICDLWARLIRHAYQQLSVHNGQVMVFKQVGRSYPEDYDRFRPEPEERISGEIISFWPRFMGHEVVLCLFEGLNPRDGLMILDGDTEAASLLSQISDESLQYVLSLIHEGQTHPLPLWLEALCDKAPLTEDRIAKIYDQHQYSGCARDLISMIKICQSRKWTLTPPNSAYLRAKLDQLEKL